MSTELTLDAARELDAADELRDYRERFNIPHYDGKPWQYFCGHSLGLMAKSVPASVEAMIAQWRDLAVNGHFQGADAWLTYHEQVRTPLAQLVGARVEEVTVMNALTVNLHLLMASFYRPQGQRRKIVIEKAAFPSDRYAVIGQLQWHGLDPAECLVEIEPPTGDMVHGSDGLRDYLATHGDEVALVLWPGVQYVTGERFDIKAITEMVHAAGAVAGFDLAHMVGNVPVALHDSGADFAAWCSYKYLNSGPGAVSGVFVHQRHHDRDDLVKLTGWWANDVSTRFKMDPELDPAAGVSAWQISNPPILTLAPLSASLKIFMEADMQRLRAKAVMLTGFLEQLIQTRLSEQIEIITPTENERRGCQLSLRIRHRPEISKPIHDALTADGVIVDWRAPDVIRYAPVPLYNTFSDVWHGVQRLEQELHAHR
ncbi:MAG: kynureninase [Wenzhouxiangellaceae bacterium]